MSYNVAGGLSLSNVLLLFLCILHNVSLQSATFASFSYPLSIFGDPMNVSAHQW